MSGKAARVVITERQQAILEQFHDGGLSTATAGEHYPTRV
jgi:hypothetical protein